MHTTRRLVSILLAGAEQVTSDAIDAVKDDSRLPDEAVAQLEDVQLAQPTA